MRISKQDILSGILLTIGILICGWLLRIAAPGILISILAGYLLLPLWIVSIRQRTYREQQFREASTYMEQMTFSFYRQQKILDALYEVVPLFPQGEMHDKLEQVIHHIVHDYEADSSTKAALDELEEAYPWRHMHTMHRFLEQIEEIGGDYVPILRLLQKDREVWVEETVLYQEECRKSRRNVWVAMLIALLVCSSTGYILPARIAVSSLMLYQVATVVFLIAGMVILVQVERKMARALKEEQGEQEAKIIQQYRRYLDYREQAEIRHSLLWATGPILFLFISIYRASRFGIGLALILVIITLFQHRIGHYLLGRNLIRKIEKAFPQWLMEVSLLIQTENVQVSIEQTREDAPIILQEPLKELMEKLHQTPESIQPYLEFLQEFHIADVQAAMKMLYAISQGNEAMAGDQLEELITRNHMMLEQALKTSNEDKLAGMYLYFLAPALLGALKLVMDMSLFLVMFLSQSNVG